MYRCPWCGSKQPFFKKAQIPLPHTEQCQECKKYGRVKISAFFLFLFITGMVSISLHSISKVFLVVGILVEILALFVYGQLPFVRYDKGDLTHSDFKCVSVSFEWVPYQFDGLFLSNLRVTEDWIFDVEYERKLQHGASFAIVEKFQKNKSSGTVLIPKESSDAQTFYLCYKGKKVLRCTVQN